MSTERRVGEQMSTDAHPVSASTLISRTPAFLRYQTPISLSLTHTDSLTRFFLLVVYLLVLLFVSVYLSQTVSFLTESPAVRFGVKIYEKCQSSDVIALSLFLCLP